MGGNLSGVLSTTGQCGRQPRGGAYNRRMSVRLGLERLLDGPDRKLIAGQRIGLVCNPASIDSRIMHASDRLAAGHWTLTAPFGPPHGLPSDPQANMIESPHAHEPK